MAAVLRAGARAGRRALLPRPVPPFVADRRFRGIGGRRLHTLSVRPRFGHPRRATSGAPLHMRYTALARTASQPNSRPPRPWRLVKSSCRRFKSVPDTKNPRNCRAALRRCVSALVGSEVHHQVATFAGAAPTETLATRSCLPLVNFGLPEQWHLESLARGRLPCHERYTSRSSHAHPECRGHLVRDT